MASNVATLILLSFEKSFEVEINFSYSTNVCRSTIARVSSVPINSQRLVFANQMVCDEDATIQVLKSCIEANKMDNSAVRAVLLDVSKKVETSETTLSALSVLNKLSVYQCEQALALATMANQNNMQNMQSMMSRLRGNAQQAMSYEEKHMQIEALKVVPLLDLYERAFKSENPKTSFSDELLCQLLAWFKFRFFSWTNQPQCMQCQGATSFIGGGQPNAEEIEGQAGRVELYRCSSCNVITRFPRYNNPVKLLKTRTGRCGEWANCFTLCCRSVGLEARYISDWTDHVWTEVYSPSLKRWLHCDSCENAMDAPLMYESGWGKKLNYVIAFSRDEVVDVTRRYTNKLSEVMDRRNLVSEPWLDSLITMLDRKQRTFTFLSATRCMQLGDRRRVELKHFTDGPDSLDRNREAEQCGRISGDVAWRSQRNELGTGVARERAIQASSSQTATQGTEKVKAPIRAVKKISVRAGGLIDCVTFFDKEDRVICKAGGNGGDQQEDFVLGDNENIVKITQKHGDSLDSITFYTNLGRSKKYGGDGGSKVGHFSVASADTEMIVGVRRNESSFCGEVTGIIVERIKERNSSDGEDLSSVEESKE